MIEDTDRLKDWTFKIDEISANIYKVWGIDKLGRSVERIGIDLDLLLAECRADAMKISDGLQRDNGQA